MSIAEAIRPPVETVSPPQEGKNIAQDFAWFLNALPQQLEQVADGAKPKAQERSRLNIYKLADSLYKQALETADTPYIRARALDGFVQQLNTVFQADKPAAKHVIKPAYKQKDTAFKVSRNSLI